jgi:hypothetical protein
VDCPNCNSPITAGNAACPRCGIDTETWPPQPVDADEQVSVPPIRRNPIVEAIGYFALGCLYQFTLYIVINSCLYMVRNGYTPFARVHVTPADYILACYVFPMAAVGVTAILVRKRHGWASTGLAVSLAVGLTFAILGVLRGEPNMYR